MRTLALIPLLMLAAFGSAQQPNTKEMLLGRKVFLTFMPQVKEELKLSTEQNDKMKAAFGDSLRVEGDKIMIMMGPETDFDQMEKDAMAVLSKDQMGRLNELWVQKLGGLVLLDEETAKELKLTEDQKKQVQKIGEETTSQLMEIFSSGDVQEADVKKSATIRKDAGKKMEGVLDEAQKKSLEAKKGKLVAWKDEKGGSGL